MNFERYLSNIFQCPPLVVAAKNDRCIMSSFVLFLHFSSGVPWQEERTKENIKNNHNALGQFVYVSISFSSFLIFHFFLPHLFYDVHLHSTQKIYIDKYYIAKNGR